MDLKEQFIGFLRDYRHDWLNHLQIIKAYISLDKKDELSRFLDQLMIKAHEEAQLGQLGDIELSYFLLTYNWIQDKLQLEVEIESIEGEHLSQIGKEYPYLLTWVKALTQSMEEICLSDHENRLLLLISNIDGQLKVGIDLLGAWNKQLVQEKLISITELVAQNQGTLKHYLQDHAQLSFELIAKKLDQNRGVGHVCR